MHRLCPARLSLGWGVLWAVWNRYERRKRAWQAGPPGGPGCAALRRCQPLSRPFIRCRNAGPHFILHAAGGSAHRGRPARWLCRGGTQQPARPPAGWHQPRLWRAHWKSPALADAAVLSTLCGWDAWKTVAFLPRSVALRAKLHHNKGAPAVHVGSQGCLNVPCPFTACFCDSRNAIKTTC